LTHTGFGVTFHIMKPSQNQNSPTAPKYFIVKHGLDAFKALPNFVWRTGMGPNDVPHRFAQIKAGDRWIGFAYTTSDRRERSLSLVTGFFECTHEVRYGEIPREGRMPDDEATKAWMIEGIPHGEQPRHEVGIPPIGDLLQKRLWNNQAIIPVTRDDFAVIRDYTLCHQLNPNRIPFLRREPKCEQELLAVVISGHKKLGIERIVRIRAAFPDLLVKLEGKREEVHLELELYSEGFFSHGHHHQVRNHQFKEDHKPVAVLCWIDNDKSGVKQKVHRVYELQSLIRERKKIRW